MISKSCAKITLTNDEAQRLDIGFDNFECDNPEANTFLGYVLMVLEDVGVIHSAKDKISVEIFEQENGDLIIYVSSSHDYDQNSEYPSQFVFSTQNPPELFEFCKLLNKNMKKTATNLKLYQYNNSYCLIFHCVIPKMQLRNKLYPFEFTTLDMILLAKIEEYGKLLCDTPLNKLK